MGYRTIVVGTDGSPTATMARDAAIRLAKRLRAKLVLVSAYNPPTINRGTAEGLLQHALDAAVRGGVDAVAEMDEREPAELILGTAERHGADLIVVGNKGFGDATRFRLGSVPDRVAHSAPCDLLIIDTTKFAERTARTGGSYKRIMAGTDGSPTATEAARKAMELAMQVRADVTLVYVGDPIVGAITLEETAAGKPEGVHVDPYVIQGDPSEKLLELAETADIDLLVVGNKGMAGPRRFFLGSVPNKVAHYASTDVLIVKTVDRSIEELAPGHGGVVDVGGKKLAVYRDEAGLVRALSPKCTHMGCTVDWNDSERTWDCPCHGSRFSVEGEVLRGPAAKPLAVQALGRKDEAPLASTRPSGNGARGRERIVIVGASLAGGTAAATLREARFDGSIVLIGAEEHLPYERPPLSKSFLRGETPFEDSMVNPEAFYQETGVELRLGSSATGVDSSRKVVILQGGEEVPYDKLLVTTGARNRRFPIPGMDLEGIHTLRTVDDARRIQAEIAPGCRAVIGGMGFIGSEVAASLRGRGVEVVAVDGGKVPLQRVLGEDIGAVLASVHREHGVDIVPEDRVAAFEGSGRVERVMTAGGRTLDCDFVVLGLGVEPLTQFVEGSGVDLDNGILVDELCRTNVEGIFAAGDVANHQHAVFGRRLRVEHWHHAIHHARAAAHSMMGNGAPYRDVHWFWSDQYDQNLQYAGFAAEWDDLVIRGSLEAREFTAFYLKDGRVLAAASLNRADGVESATALIASGEKVGPDSLPVDTQPAHAPPSP